MAVIKIIRTFTIQRPPKDKICDFDCVTVSIPKKLMHKCFYSPDRLTAQEGYLLRAKLIEVEHKKYQLEHVASIIERMLLRA